MKLLISIIMIFSATPAFASVEFYTVRTDQAMSMGQLANVCQKDETEAAAKLKQISDRLLPGQEGVLSVEGTYGRISHRSGSSRFPTYTYEYYCILDFKSKDASISFDASRAIMYTRISRANWDTACKSEYESALSNPDSPISVHWLGWALFQGRYCEVTTVKVLKKNVQ